MLILGSCAIATFGLLSNSAAVIIGAMIVAPLMLPIRGLAFGALEGNVVLFRKGLIAIVVGTLLAIFLAWLVGSLVGLPEFGSEVVARSEPTLLDLGIAVAAGGISGFAKVEPKVSSTLAGTAIAVALMPPICVNWLSDPPEVRLSVRTKGVLTPTQVRLLEEFLQKETGQKFTLIFEVGQFEEVRRENLTQPDSEPTP